MRQIRLFLLAGLVAGGASAAPAARSDPPRLSFPIACKIGETCEIQNYVDRDPGPGAKDYRCGSRTYQAHGGVDIRIADMAAQRAGVAVLAAAPGKVSRLRDGVADISVKATNAPGAAGQECGNGVVVDHGGGWETQYCHLARGSVTVKAGDTVAAGQAIARVGLSGNTEYPHLHITVRRAGVMVDPFAPSAAPGACDANATASAGLWNAQAAAQMSYKTGAVLNVGFAAAPVDMPAVEERRIVPAAAGAAALVAYVRAIDLDQGDEQALVVTGPNGAVLAETKIPALDHSKAQYLIYVGRKRPAAGWSPGVYKGVYTASRGGRTVIRRAFEVRL